MATNVASLTLEKFHKFLHKDIDKPVKDFRWKKRISKKGMERKHTGAHRASWAKTTIFPKQKLITVKVYLNFKKNKLTEAEYNKLKRLACQGINQYWSRRIKVAGNDFMVRVKVSHRLDNAIPVNLYIETDKNKYARSMNPAILGIDARFIYNKGHFGNSRKADANFKIVSAHEFGHSVLMYSGGIRLSWGHKGSTGIISQSVKTTTPGYPSGGAIDLMKYYDEEKATVLFNVRIRDTISMEIDVKRLIWGGNIQWQK